VALRQVLGEFFQQEEFKMRKSLHLTTEFWPRKWPCFAIGFMSGGDEFVLHLYLICLRVRWGY